MTKLNRWTLAVVTALLALPGAAWAAEAASSAAACCCGCCGG
jgi:hypothetical protein